MPAFPSCFRCRHLLALCTRGNINRRPAHHAQISKWRRFNSAVRPGVEKGQQWTSRLMMLGSSTGEVCQQADSTSSGCPPCAEKVALCMGSDWMLALVWDVSESTGAENAIGSWPVLLPDSATARLFQKTHPPHAPSPHLMPCFFPPETRRHLKEFPVMQRQT